MKLACRAVRMRLPSLDADTGVVEPFASHVESCLRCQVEMTRYRSLQRSLAGLATQVETAPDGIVAYVEARLATEDVSLDRPPARLGRLAGAAGAVVAAAGTVAMVKWMRARSAA
jgi:hypothetical protein